MATVEEHDSAQAPDPLDAGSPPLERLSNHEHINLLRWHLDRYDRLRASTASRASVVLSAAAILSAGNVVILAQLLNGSGLRMPSWLLGTFTVALIVSTSLVVVSLIVASNVLVTARDSRTLLSAQGDLPPGLLFNGTDTVNLVGSYAQFSATIAGQGEADVRQAAQVELWIGIQQHRHRYVRLRRAVRLLRYAGLAFLLILISVMVANLIVRL